LEPTIDVYLHRVDPSTPIEETVGAMAQLVKETGALYRDYRAALKPYADCALFGREACARAASSASEDLADNTPGAKLPGFRVRISMDLELGETYRRDCGEEGTFFATGARLGACWGECFPIRAQRAEMSGRTWH
jgi:hypothetical protein